VDRVATPPASDIERSTAGARRLAAEHPVQELRPGRAIPRGEADALQQAIRQHPINLGRPDSCRQRTW
jgi:hypothetical protein